jgi:hypothetical protein
MSEGFPPRYTSQLLSTRKKRLHLSEREICKIYYQEH